MRILDCHVENFGTLSQRDFAFTDGLNCVLEDNGAGKSTLAGFIQAMFYGLPQSRKANLEDNDRRRFLPWQGGAFGGSLTFETGGQGEKEGARFRVVRFFGQRNSEDTFSLYDADTGLESRAFTDNLGFELFGVDADTYARSVFHPQRHLSFSESAAVSARLGNLDDNGEDMLAYDGALKAVERKRKVLELTGGRGEIAETEREIAAARVAIAACRDRLDELDALREEIAARDGDISEAERAWGLARSRAREAARLGELRAKADARAMLLHTRESAERELARIAEAYPRGLPAADELSENLALEAQAERLCAQAAGFAVTHADRARQDALSARFADPDGARAQIEAMMAQAGRVTAFDAPGGDGARLLEADRRMAQTLERFPRGVPASGEVSARIADCARLEGLCAAQAAGDKSARRHRRTAWLACLGVGITLSGAVCAFFLQAPGIALIAAGLLTLAAAGFLYIKSQAASRGAGTADPAEIERLERQVGAFMDGYAIAPQPDRRAALEKARDAALDYESEKRRRESLLPAQERRNDAAAALTAALTDFGADPSRGYPAAVMSISAALSEYETLREAIAAGDARSSEAYKKAYAINAGTEAFIRRYAEPAGDRAAALDALRAAREAHARQSAAREEAARALAAFDAENDPAILSALPEARADEAALEQDERGCAARVTALREEAALMRREADDLSENAVALTEWETRLDELNAALAQKTGDLVTLKLTAQFLEEAKDEIALGYMALMRAGLRRYAGLVTGLDAANLSIDAAFNVTVQVRGENRRVEAFSRGQRDIFDICTRLALSDALYPDEKVFMILDDPFANLDDKNLSRASALLAKLAADRQIVYLACHSSRMPAPQKDAIPGAAPAKRA